jgi:hypothetical protein
MTPTKEEILNQITGKSTDYLRGNFVTLKQSLEAMESYAEQKAWDAWKAGVACRAGLYQIDIKDFEKWWEEQK